MIINQKNLYPINYNKQQKTKKGALNIFFYN